MTNLGVPASGARFQRPPTAQEAVLAELRNWILTGRLRPGEQIRQDAISAELGVSRVPVREALKMLEGEGHVTSRPHRGYFVVDLQYEDLVEIYVIRKILEDEAVRRSVPLVTPERIQQMEETLEQVEEAARVGDIIELTAANRRFHFLTFEAAGMPRLLRLIRVLWDASDPYRSIYFIEDHHRDAVNDEHRAIIDAIKAGAIDDVLALLDHHRRNAVAALEVVLTTAKGSQDGEGGPPASA